MDDDELLYVVLNFNFALDRLVLSAGPEKHDYRGNVQPSSYWNAIEIGIFDCTERNQTHIITFLEK